MQRQLIAAGNSGSLDDTNDRQRAMFHGIQHTFDGAHSGLGRLALALCQIDTSAENVPLGAQHNHPLLSSRSFRKGFLQRCQHFQIHRVALRRAGQGHRPNCTFPIHTDHAHDRFLHSKPQAAVCVMMSPRFLDNLRYAISRISDRLAPNRQTQHLSC